MSDAWRATAYLSLFFFIFGFQLPYLPLWLEEARGLTGLQIGAVIFGALLARIVIGPLISAWADARSARIASLIMAIGGFLGYLALGLAFNPPALIIIGFVLMSIVHAIVPLAEASLLLVTTTKFPNFGQGRAIASSVFVLGVLAGAKIIEASGADKIVPVITALFAVLILVACLGPRSALGRANGNVGGDMNFWQRMQRGMSLFRRPSLFLLLVSASSIQAAHAFYYGFSTVVWDQQNFSETKISLLWSTGVILEVIFLTFVARLPNWVTPERLILIGGLGAVARWTVYGFGPPLISTFFLQNLHALTFAATFIGTVKLVSLEVSKEDQALALSLIASVTGTFMGLAGIFSGFLYDEFGAGGYWAMTVLAAVGVVFASLLMLRLSTRLNR